VNKDAERAREQLELARATAAKLEQERQALVKTLDPSRRVVGPEELRLLTESSAWIEKIYKAEHALFKAKSGTPGIIGSNGAYQWLTSTDHDISALLRLCPDVVLNKYLAVTSIDSGVLHLTEEEKRGGWWTADDGKVFRGLPSGGPEDRDDWRVTYSPLVRSIHGLPNETHDECCAGFDEWYVFDKPVPAGEFEVFVNWIGFRLYDPAWKWFTDRFWEQMARLTPESYIAEGTVFTFATRNAGLFTSFLAAFSANPGIES
jgi:hypothetical protein